MSRNGWQEWTDNTGEVCRRLRSFTTHGNNLLNLLLPRFNQARFEVETLSRFRPDIFRPIDTAKINRQIRDTGGNILNILIIGLDIAESAAKLIPVAGTLVEGACGVLRKIIAATKVCE